MAISALLKAANSNSPLIQRRQNNFGGTKSSSSVYFLPNPQYAAAAASLRALLDRETVMKLQVCLFVEGQSLQKDLNRIARTTDISSDQNGWEHILKGEMSQNYYRQHSEVAEKCFEKPSQKERSKSGVETLVNLDDMEMRSIDSRVPNEFKSTYMMVTIIVSAQMLFIPDMPTINGHGDIKEALRVLQLVCDKRLHGVNVFWTPQKENDVLSPPEDIRKDYLHLRPLVCDKKLLGLNVLLSPEDPVIDYLDFKPSS